MTGDPEFESRCYKASTTALAIGILLIGFGVFLWVTA